MKQAEKNKKSILVDLIATQTDGQSKFHGGGEYAKEIFHSILKNRNHQEITFIFDPSRPLDSSITRKFDTPGCQFVAIKDNKKLQKILSNNKFEVYYAPLFRKDHLALEFGETKFILTIHGLRSIEMPRDKFELYYSFSIWSLMRFCYRMLFSKHDIQRKRNIYSVLSRKADVIVVPSNHTKYSLLSSIKNIGEDKIRVLYSPRKANNRSMNDNFVEKLVLEDQNFILLISSNRWLKNAYRAVRAIDELYSQGISIPSKTLLLGVTNPWTFKFIKNKSRFILKNYVSQEELDSCYKKAALFVYPTLNEGFGYPPLEAMKYGTPVVASAIGSIPEICGDAVMYINPLSVDEIKTRITQCCCQEGVIENLREKGPKQSSYIGLMQDDMLATLTRLILFGENKISLSQ
ncbi:glycosyltransferase [Desulforhopalus sp. IMCC35007]|uniref:glycosyltransferase n=1 Tax=Desulforhopalus sp. IMCC35007 TaxID=2569543 RepID=UPI0010AE75C9|nr:glycosyltransferase [Desulforhopalus sp. IMCC35007]TKB09915.1 glycosyltransferase family 4 protein [Desulforhopalus sp. IMCC35007]